MAVVEDQDQLVATKHVLAIDSHAVAHAIEGAFIGEGIGFLGTWDGVAAPAPDEPIFRSRSRTWPDTRQQQEPGAKPGERTQTWEASEAPKVQLDHRTTPIRLSDMG